MVSSGWNTCGREQPKYQPPPRSGNAFVAAVLAATADAVILIALFGFLAQWAARRAAQDPRVPALRKAFWSSR